VFEDELERESKGLIKKAWIFGVDGE